MELTYIKCLSAGLKTLGNVRSGASPATSKHVGRYNLSQVEPSATKMTTHLGNPEERVIWSSWPNKNNICLKACGGSFRKESVAPSEHKSINWFVGQPLQRAMELWHFLACLCSCVCRESESRRARTGFTSNQAGNSSCMQFQTRFALLISGWQWKVS